jgi:glycosyltransferase involved in cell wall biosynthesis
MTMLANSRAELHAMQERGLEAILCNHNAFVDERTFRPLAQVRRVHDAVYDAALRPVKRHELATKIGSLALISYPSPFPSEKGYAEAVAKLLPHAHWFNDPMAADWRWLSAREVNEALNQCRVGLCLSEAEGAMYASIQYLLAGLAVVSTESVGGRDVFFDDEYVIIAPPEPDAIASAVQSLIDRDLSPGMIRERTLEEVETHRRSLVDFVQRIFEAEGESRRFHDDWPHVYRERLVEPGIGGSLEKVVEYNRRILRAVNNGRDFVT